MFEEDTQELGTPIFQSEIAMTGGIGFTVGDLTLHPDVLQDTVYLQQFFEVARDLRDAQHAGEARIACWQHKCYAPSASCVPSIVINVCPYSTGCPSCTRISMTRPAAGASTSLITLRDSIAATCWPALTWSPTTTSAFPLGFVAEWKIPTSGATMLCIVSASAGGGAFTVKVGGAIACWALFSGALTLRSTRRIPSSA